MMKFHDECFGRVVLLAGRLAVLSRHLRDVHRFGFETLVKLAEEGGRAIDDAVEWIRKNTLKQRTSSAHANDEGCL